MIKYARQLVKNLYLQRRTNAKVMRLQRVNLVIIIDKTRTVHLARHALFTIMQIL
jgi:hypothetical protein